MKLKIKIILFIFAILLEANVFAQSTGLGQEGYGQGSGEYQKMYAGFMVSGGMSITSKALYMDGKRITKPSFGITGVFQYFFLKNIGFSVDLGYNYFHVRDDDNMTNEISSFKIHTIVLSVMPVFKFKGIYFGFGIFLDFPIKGKYEGGFNLSSSLSNYSTPNIGIHFRMGYTFKVGSNKLIFAGVDVKSHTGDFYKENKRSGRVFAVHGSFGLLFGLN